MRARERERRDSFRACSTNFSERAGVTVTLGRVVGAFRETLGSSEKGKKKRKKEERRLRSRVRFGENFATRIAALSLTVDTRVTFKAAPSSERHATTYFGNRKLERRRIADVKSAYDRSRDVTPFDQRRPRCDRAQRSLIWAEIHEENKRHVVPMTANHWYGRPNRDQIDYPDARFARSSETRDFYSRGRLNMTSDGAERESVRC